MTHEVVGRLPTPELYFKEKLFTKENKKNRLRNDYIQVTFLSIFDWSVFLEAAGSRAVKNWHKLEIKPPKEVKLVLINYTHLQLHASGNTKGTRNCRLQMSTC